MPDAAPLPNLDDQLGEARTASGAFTEWGKKQAKQVFVQRLRETGIISLAMQAAGVHTRHTLSVWRAEDIGFREAWADAEAEAIDMLEQAAWERAKDGVIETYTRKDGEVGERRTFSDRLLEMLLKANRPAKYNERFLGDGSSLPPDESAALIRSKLAQIESLTGT